MESSFKKGYDKKLNADGSYVLMLKGQRRGAGKTSGYPVLLFIIFIFCAFFTNNIAEKISPQNVGGYLLAWAALAFGTWLVIYFVFKSLNSKNTDILVKPSEGLIFEGKQLPFKDIQTIGVSHQTTHNNLDGNAQVYAASHGSNINLTGWMPLALAEAVANEIKKSSGMSWQ